MNMNQIIKDRFSVRSYKNIPVEHEKLLQVLEAARVAPSGYSNVEMPEKQRKTMNEIVHWEVF